MNVIDDHTRLLHIRDAANRVIAYTDRETLESLIADEKLQLALVRLIEIIGEAAARISTEFKLAHTQIPWPVIVGMRNRLIHAYFDIDLDIVWDTVTLAVPPLLEQVEELLKQLKDEDD